MPFLVASEVFFVRACVTGGPTPRAASPFAAAVQHAKPEAERVSWARRPPTLQTRSCGPGAADRCHDSVRSIGSMKRADLPCDFVGPRLMRRAESTCRWRSTRPAGRCACWRYKERIMTPAREVPAGTLVFLECGCSGNCGISRVDGPVMVIVSRPCKTHGSSGQPFSRYLKPWELVSPLSPFDLESA